MQLRALIIGLAFIAACDVLVGADFDVGPRVTTGGVGGSAGDGAMTSAGGDGGTGPGGGGGVEDTTCVPDPGPGATFARVALGHGTMCPEGWVVLAERSERRARLMADPRWQAYAVKTRPLQISQENKILIPAPFSPWAQDDPSLDLATQ